MRVKPYKIIHHHFLLECKVSNELHIKYLINSSPNISFASLNLYSFSFDLCAKNNDESLEPSYSNLMSSLYLSITFGSKQYKYSLK